MAGQLIGEKVTLNGLSDLDEHLPGNLVRYRISSFN